MSFENLIRDLKTLISTWDKYSSHKRCMEMFIADKVAAHKSRKGDSIKTNNTKTNVLERSSDNLKHQTKKLLKKSYKPILPSTYVKGKIHQSLKPDPISINGMDQTADESTIGEFKIIKAIRHEEGISLGKSLSEVEASVPVSNRFGILANHPIDIADCTSETVNEIEQAPDNDVCATEKEVNINIKSRKTSNKKSATSNSNRKPINKEKNPKASSNETNNDPEKNQIGKNVKLTPKSSELIKKSGDCFSLQNCNVKLDRVISQDTDQDDFTKSIENTRRFLDAWEKNLKCRKNC